MMSHYVTLVLGTHVEETVKKFQMNWMTAHEYKAMRELLMNMFVKF